MKTLLSLVITVVFVPGASLGALLEVDLFEVGDGLVTRDTQTSLDWLDVNVALGQSFDAVSQEFGPGGEFEGFRYASRDEIITLWRNAGIVDIDLPGFLNFTAGNLDGANRIVELLGTTPFFSQTVTRGISSTPHPSISRFRLTPQVEIGFSDASAEARTNGVIDVGYGSSNTGSWLVRPSPPLLGVEIDIKPGSDPTSINPFSRGVIPIAILGSETFDVNDVDPDTLAFGPAGAPLVHPNGPHSQDVHSDGFTDLVGHYRTLETGIATGDTEACLTGETFDGIPLEGCDAIRTEPGCGIGFELLFVLPPLMSVYGRRGRPIHSPCTSPGDVGASDREAGCAEALAGAGEDPLASSRDPGRVLGRVASPSS